MSAWIIFTDLDETLLDRESFSFDAARPALEEVRRRAIPLILCTSKTAAETRHFQGRLGIDAPFVVEDGAGVFIPRGYFPSIDGPVADRGAHVLVSLCPPRRKALEVMERLKRLAPGALRGFDDMTVEEVAREAGLPPEMARLARDREFDEPFRFLRREAELAARVTEVARRNGMRVTKGGRFHHLHGETDKGRAVERLKSLFARKLGAIRTLAVGDAPLDLPMLAAADVPIAVQRRDGTHAPELVAGVARLRCVPAPGPAGWNLGVMDALGGA